MLVMFAVFLGFTWCIVNARVAREKGRKQVTAFLLSLVLTPLMVYLYLLAVPVTTAVWTQASRDLPASAPKKYLTPEEEAQFLKATK